jgi:hypothetical protein
MKCTSASPESLAAVQRLERETAGRGEECLALLLAGVRLYASLGREYELLEIMRKFAEEMKESVENTPTAQELHRLFHWNPPEKG